MCHTAQQAYGKTMLYRPTTLDLKADENIMLCVTCDLQFHNIVLYPVKCDFWFLNLCPFRRNM